MAGSAKDIDQFDLGILGIVQIDNQTPQRSIAERVNLSAPAIQRRLKRLKDDGVIAANVAVVDPAALGYPLTILVEVSVESERIDLLDAMKRDFRAHPNVQQCYYVTGEFDFAIVLTARDMTEYENLTRALFFKNNNVKRFRTLVVMDRVKVGLVVPVGNS